MPRSKYFRRARSAYAGTVSTTQSAPASSQPAPSQRLHPAHPRSTACAISTARECHPNVWSNSTSRIGSVSTPASCPNRSCPVRAVRFAVWSNSSSWIASNTASGAASRCPIFISSDGERAGAIASALVGSPTCSSICHTVAGSVTFLQMLFGYRSYEELHYAVPDCWCDDEDVRVLLTALFPKNNIGNISGRVNANLFGAH